MIPERITKELLKIARDGTNGVIQPLGGTKNRFFQIRGGVCWLNETKAETILENIYCTSFEKMYPNIILNIHRYISKLDNNIVPINRTESILEGNSNLFDDRVVINSLFATLMNPYHQINTHNKNKGLIIGNMCVHYGRMIMHDYVNKDETIYIDTDAIYHTNPFPKIDYGIPYSTENIDMSIFFRRKQYMSCNGKTKSHGRFKGDYWEQVENKYKRIFDKKVRNKRLEKILS